MNLNSPRLRLDKWLWFARFFKTRSLASKMVATGRIRVDGVPVSKPSRMISVGNVLTFSQGDRVRIVRIAELGERRGPAVEAQTLYEDMSPEPVRDLSAPRVGPRPDKRARRQMQRIVE